MARWWLRILTEVARSLTSRATGLVPPQSGKTVSSLQGTLAALRADGSAAFPHFSCNRACSACNRARPFFIPHGTLVAPHSGGSAALHHFSCDLACSVHNRARLSPSHMARWCASRADGSAALPHFSCDRACSVHNRARPLPPRMARWRLRVRFEAAHSPSHLNKKALPRGAAPLREGFILLGFT